VGGVGGSALHLGSGAGLAGVWGGYLGGFGVWG